MSTRRTGLGGMRAAAAAPRLRRLLASDLVSGSADAAYWLALIVELARHSNADQLIAAAVIARLAPRLIFGFIGGAAADRFDRRRLLMSLDASRAVLMTLLAAAVAAEATPFVIVAIVFVSCAIGTPYRTTVSSAVPVLVDEDMLGPANALGTAIGQIVNLIGPIVGLALLSVAPTWCAFVVNAISYAIAVVLIHGTGTLGRSRHRDEQVAILADLRAGMRAMAADPSVAAIVGSVAAATLLRGFELVLHVRVAADRLGLGPEGYGVLSAAAGIGAIAALPWAAQVATTTRPSLVMLTSALGGAATLSLLAVVEHPLTGGIVVAIDGASIVVFEVAAITSLQLTTSPDVLGRVLGVQNALSGAAKLVGALLAPVFLAAVDLELALALVTVVVAGSMLLSARPLAAVDQVLADRARRVKPLVEVLRTLPIFTGVSAVALQRLALVGTEEHVKRGRTVLRQGDPADDFFVIAEGSVDVDVDGGRIATLGRHDWLGEIGLVHGTPRTATATATRGSRIWRFPGTAFIDAVTASGVMPDPLLSDIADRSAQQRRGTGGAI